MAGSPGEPQAAQLAERRPLPSHNSHKHEEAAPESSVGEELQACSICLEAAEGDVITLPCRHGYHRACIGEWLKASRGVLRCPLCRAEFPEELLVELEWGDFALVPILAALWLSMLAVRVLVRQSLALCRAIRHPLDAATSLERGLRIQLATLVRLLYVVWLFFGTSFIVLATAGRVRGAFRSAYETVQLLLLAVFLLMGKVTRCALDTAAFAADCVLSMLSVIIAGTASQVARLLLGLAGTMSWIAHQAGVTTLELVMDSWALVTNCSRVAT